MAAPVPFQQSSPTRTPQATTRLAWLIMGIASVCCLLVCLLAGYGLWRFRASIMGPQEGNTLEAYANPVSLIRVGEVQAIAVPLQEPVPLREGGTVRVEESVRPGANTLVTLWDGSTLQLYAGTRVTFSRLQGTLYSDRFQRVLLDIPAGQVVLGVAQIGRYQQVHFSVRTPEAIVDLEPGGTYLLRAGGYTELAVSRGQAHVAVDPDSPAVLVKADEKAIVRAGEPLVVEPARWQLLDNGDFAQGWEGWTFRSVQFAGGGTVDATALLEQYPVGDQLVWAVGLQRKGGLEDRGQAILSQEVEEDLSPYQSVRLEFDLRINYQSLPGGGQLGIDYPFNVRIHYRDAAGENRQYVIGFYDHTEKGFKTDFPEPGETFQIPHYRWQHISLQLLDLEPRPVMLNGVDLFASGNDYLSWVANISLTAELRALSSVER